MSCMIITERSFLHFW